MHKQALALHALELGGGIVSEPAPGRHIMFLPSERRGYADAQLDDYRFLPRSRFPWQPPLLMTLRARVSQPEPPGTFGFGFWNDPFTLSLGQGGAARRLPAAPNAIWFFYGSKPNDMALAPGVPGHGWKAASLRTPAIPTLLLTPPALVAVALAQIPMLRRPVMKTALGIVQASEVILDFPVQEWHTYQIAWEVGRARFLVDGVLMLEAAKPPTGPLGFVAWIDNQYAIASPRGGFRFGVLPTTEEQWLEIEALSIEASPSA